VFGILKDLQQTKDEALLQILKRLGKRLSQRSVALIEQSFSSICANRCLEMSGISSKEELVALAISRGWKLCDDGFFEIPWNNHGQRKTENLSMNLEDIHQLILQSEQLVDKMPEWTD